MSGHDLSIKVSTRIGTIHGGKQSTGQSLRRLLYGLLAGGIRETVRRDFIDGFVVGSNSMVPHTQRVRQRADDGPDHQRVGRREELILYPVFRGRFIPLPTCSSYSFSEYGGEGFNLTGLVSEAEPPDRVITSDRYGTSPDGDSSEQVVRCAICGTPESQAPYLPVGYANPVCDDCDELAMGEGGETPWTGWRPGEKPDSKPGVIQMPPDTGENPVYTRCKQDYTTD